MNDKSVVLDVVEELRVGYNINTTLIESFNSCTTDALMISIPLRRSSPSMIAHEILMRIKRSGIMKKYDDPIEVFIWYDDKLCNKYGRCLYYEFYSPVKESNVEEETVIED